MTVESNFIAVFNDRLIGLVAEAPSKTNSTKTEVVAYAMYEAPGTYTLAADKSPERLACKFQDPPLAGIEYRL